MSPRLPAADRAQLSGGLITRRTFSAALLSGAVLTALAACGSDPEVAQSASTTAPAEGTSAGSSAAATAEATTSAASSASQTAAAPAFPVSLQNKFGTTEIPAQPTKVVSVGLTEQDFLLALGVVPIGVTDWYGKQPNAVWPWATAALGDAKPKVLSNADGLQFLEIAKLTPDLIVGPNSGMTEEDYTKLKQIAPTVATPSEAKSEYFDSWPLYLETIGAAVGKSAEAAELEASIRAQFAKAAADHPEFAGKKVIFLQNAVYDGNFIAYQQGLGTEFLTDLGFTIPAELDEYVPAEGGQALIPAERIEVLNTADYLVWATEKDEDRVELEKVPGFGNLTAVKAGQSVYTGGILSGAIYFSSPLSLPYIVENLVPLLADKS